MPKYIKQEVFEKFIENRKTRGDCKFCDKYERCLENNINRKGSHLYCWEPIKLPIIEPVEVIHCKDCLRSDDSVKGINDIYCRKHMRWVDKEGFCSDGVRG